MPDLSWFNSRGRMLLSLLVIVPVGAMLSTPVGSPQPDRGADTASAGGDGQWVAEFDQSGSTQQPITHAQILERFAAAGGPIQEAENPEAVGLTSDAGEGEVTRELPANYVVGAPPAADLAAALRQSQARNAGASTPQPAGLAAALTRNPRITFTRQSQIDDLLSGKIDPRLVDVLTWIAQRRSNITITSMATDHSTCVAGSNPCRVSAHKLGRAVDIASVNGEACVGTQTGQCGLLFQEIVNNLRGTPYQPSQAIYGFDLWPSESWNFFMSNHRDHIHLGY